MTEQRSSGAGQMAAFAVVACLAALVAVVWLWGGLAGTLGSGWPRVRAGDLLGVLARVGDLETLR